MKKIWFIILPFALILFTGCGKQETQNINEFAEVKAGAACGQICTQAMVDGVDLSIGPCLANPLPEYSDWVCDVAHTPRIPADELPANQCSAFQNKTAKSFVEYSPDCTLIRTVAGN